MFILLISLQENKNKNKEKNANFVDLVVRRENIVVWYFFISDSSVAFLCIPKSIIRLLVKVWVKAIGDLALKPGETWNHSDKMFSMSIEKNMKYVI